jgi:hypothetical protein
MRTLTATALLAAVLAWPSLAAAAPRAEERAPPAPADLPVKPTGPIGLEYRVAAQPSVGVPLEIAVTARVQADVGRVTIEAAASSTGAALVTAPALVRSGEGVYAWTITVVPLTAQAGYLSVIVAGDVDGVAQARSITVPLRSADASGSVPAASAGGREALIALPVQESP